MELYKIMLAGDVSTGKTSFLTQLIYQSADRNPTPTQTLSFFALKLTNPDANVQLWDSPGDPRFHYQVISNLATYKSLLAFVDVTNMHTLDCARTLVQQVRCYSNLQVHIVESKQEVTRKDKFKRKVAPEQLQHLAAMVGGKLFHYTRDQPVQPILQTIISYSRPQTSSLKEISKQVQASSCECLLY